MNAQQPSNQALEATGEFLSMRVAWCFPDGAQFLSYLRKLVASVQFHLSDGSVVDSTGTN